MKNNRQYQLKRNIILLRIIRAVGSFLIIWPIIVLFFQENGLSLSQVFQLQSIFALVIVVMEVPSGYLADVWGRKKAVIIGTVLYAVGFSMYIFSSQWIHFVALEIVIALGLSMISGADSALLFDTLKELKTEKSYKKQDGFIEASRGFSEAIAVLIGGALALHSLKLPFIAQAITMSLAVFAALLLVEPERSKKTVEGGNIKQILKIVKYALHGHPKIKWLIIFGAVINTSTITMAWALQPILKESGVELEYFGPVIAVFAVIFAISSLFSYKLEGLLGFVKTALLTSLLVVASYLGASRLSIWFLPVVSLIWVTRGLINPVLRDSVNSLVDSEFRASLLSVQSLMFRLGFAMYGPLFGWISGVLSLGQALIITSLIAAVVLPVAVWRLSDTD